jgi:hypothetical protein
LPALVGAICVLNLVDAGLTLTWIRMGIAEEANVLMRILIDQDPLLFLAIKVFVVTACLMVLWRNRHHTLAAAGIMVAFVCYGTVTFFHSGIATVALTQAHV